MGAAGVAKWAWVVTFLLVVWACAPAPITVPDGFQLACSPDTAVRFPATFVPGPRFTAAEFTVTTEQGRALAEFFRNGDDISLYREAEGFSVVSDTLVLAYRDRVPSAFFLLEGDRILEWGPCRPSLVDEVKFSVRWRPVDPLGPDVSTFRIEVDTSRCITPDGENVPAEVTSVEVTEGRDAVTVVVWSEEPPRGSCVPLRGAATTIVRLDEPLGDRVLLDGGTVPPTSLDSRR